MEQLRTFASVSREWLLLIKETPSFWRLAASDLSLPLLRQVLSRSKGYMLDIVYSLQSSSEDIPIGQFTALVVEHVHRWRSLVAWDYSRACDIFQRLTYLSAPMLEVLDCQGMNQTVIDLFSGEAGRLRDVKLCGVCIPWESKMLSGLQTLDLERVWIGSPSGGQLLAILAASPGLIELKLYTFDLIEDALPTPPQMVSVDLPMLETLVTKDIPNQLTYNLLSAIHIPRCTTFEISYSHESDSDIGLFNDPALAHIKSLLITWIRESPLVTITWDNEGVTMDLSTPTGTATLLFVTVTDDWYFPVPAGLSSALEEAGPSEINLIFACSTMPSSILQYLGPSQSCITKIYTIGLDEFGTSDLMQFLAEPTMVDGVAERPLLKLEYLSFEHCSLEREGLLEAISSYSRYEGSGDDEQKGMSSATVPQPFVPFHLKIVECDTEAILTPEDIEALRSILGDSNFTYVLDT
ncbi:hypothetical protein FRB94_008939 [Tulasnella sp. JGI-2019a]|nr:hypothetical protein FRB94_008939 [Tulasnella sp. JGI-2019a]KAG9027403.1 hypothetical protein FRB95_007805 [Tulasnella sp. JGI-2019a]